MATQIPFDILAAVFTHGSMDVRDRGASRLVCRYWRAAVDGLTVRRLTVSSSGPGNCTLQLLRRFPLLQSLSLGSAVTSSNRATFTSALSRLQALSGHLTHLSLEFASPAAVHLPTCLHSLTRLQSLAIFVGNGLRCLGQGLSPNGTARLGTPSAFAAAEVAAAAAAGPRSGAHRPADGEPTDDEDDDLGLSDHTGDAAGSRSASARDISIAASGYGILSASSGAPGDVCSSVPVRSPPASLIPFLSVLSCLVSLELVHISASVPEVLGAVQSSSSTPSSSSFFFSSFSTVAGPPSAGASGSRPADGRTGRTLRRLVLVGSGLNLTGVDAPAVAAQLARLEVLCVDGCTGADALMRLLPYLTAVKRLDLAGMDYAWAAAAGYHRRAGFNSANDLLQHANHHNGNLQLHNHHGYGDANGPNGLALGANGNGGLNEGVGERVAAASTAAATALAAAAERPLAFLNCLPRLRSLNLAGSFLRTLPNRDISGLTGLTALDLSGNGIDDLPPGLTLLPLLRRIDVSHNELLAMPSWLAQMQSLESISCHHNSLERFPTLLYELTRLSYLAVGHNRISWWPVECVLPRQRPAPLGAGAAAAAATAGPGLPPPQTAPPPHPLLPLVSLDLSHNRLFGLPGGLAWLGALRCLRLRDSLAGLDQSGAARAMALLAGLTGLWELDLSSNHLDQHSIVPLSELRDLRKLWLADNGLEELPLGLAQLSLLTLLSLRANRFAEVPVCLRWLSRLEALDLSCNRLVELPQWIGASIITANTTIANTTTNADPITTRSNTAAANTATGTGSITATARAEPNPPAAAASDPPPPPPDDQQHQHHQHQHQYLQNPLPTQRPYKLGTPLGNQPYFRPTLLAEHQCPQRQQPQQQGEEQQGQHAWRPQTQCERHHHQQQQRQKQQLLQLHGHDGTAVASARSHFGNSLDVQPQHHHSYPQDARPHSFRTSALSPVPHNNHPPAHQNQPADSHLASQVPALGVNMGPGSSPAHGQLGLAGLRHLDVSQQYSVVIRESAVPDIPPRLEVQPPHCLYGPLQGDLPEELLRLPQLRTLVLQRHMLRMGSSVLRRLQARGVEIIHPRPLRVENLPGAAAAALNTAAAAGGLLFPSHHPVLSAAARAAGASAVGGGGGGFPLPAGAGGGGGVGSIAVQRRTVGFLGPRESLFLLAIVVLTPVAAAVGASALGLSLPPHAVVLVVVALATRLALSAIIVTREAERRRHRQRTAAAAVVAAAADVR